MTISKFLKLKSVCHSFYSLAAITLIRGLFILFTLFIIVNNAKASNKLSAEEILKAANKAERQSKFVGTLQVVKFDKGLQTSSLINVYQKNSKIKMEYISPESKGTVMIDDGVNLCKLDLKDKKAYMSCTITTTTTLKDQVERILKNYQIDQEKAERILNRQCYVLNLKPKYKFGINKKIWVDKSNWITLRTEEYAGNGNLAMASFYTQIDFKSDVDDQIFSMPEDCQKYIVQNQLDDRSDKEIIKMLEFRPIQPKHLPDGYELNGRYLEMCIVGRPVAHLRYSDGLNSFSIFEHSQKGHQAMLKEDSTQALPDVKCLLPKDYLDRVQIYSKGDLIFVIIGNLTPEEAKKVLESLK